MRPKHGFTLIELSIVLVIIALIVGGVLVGKDMIEQAQLRASLKELEAYNAATNTFRNKYAALPGDIAQPEKFGLGLGGGGLGAGGDGDGQIYSYRYFDTGIGANYMVEIFNYWYHLSQAGLLTQSYTGTAITGAAAPTNLQGYMPRFNYAKNAAFVVANTPRDANTNATFGNAFAITSFSALNATIACNAGFCSVLTGAEAMAIDSKLDDAKSRTGSVVAMFPTVGPYWSSGAGDACATITNADYDVQGTRGFGGVDNPPQPGAIDCSLLVRSSW